jgi:tRNA pseudouridine38-40 synthase
MTGPEPLADEPAVATRRVRLVVAYHGAAFHGFAANPGVRTVAGTLATCVDRVVRQPVELAGAGRTDTGVHAWGQVVSADLPASTDLEGLVRRVNAMAGPDLVVRSAAWAEPGFHARFSAQWRHYRYTVWNQPVPHPWLAATAWHVPQPLDLRRLRMAADPFVGEHDFTSFCRRPKASGEEPAPSMVRRVLAADWFDDGDGMLRFEIRGTAFCHQQVRSIVGTVVDAGMGRHTPGEIVGMLRARDRAAAGTVAPPHGLCLWSVGY